MNAWNVMSLASGGPGTISGLYVSVSLDEAAKACQRLRDEGRTEAVVMHDREIYDWIQGRMPCDQSEERCRAGYDLDARCHLDLVEIMVDCGVPLASWMDPPVVCEGRTDR